MTADKKKIEISEKLGDFFIDIAKLVFAGIVLSTLLNLTESKYLILFIGVWSTIILATIGFAIYDRTNYTKRKK